jgi:hypothetical protein
LSIANPLSSDPRQPMNVEASPYSLPPVSPYQVPVEVKMPLGEELKKYFLHGLTLSLIMLVVSLGWLFFLFFLIMVGSIVGLLIGLGVFVFVLGWVNKELIRYFWNMNPKTGWKDTLVHGVFLFGALLIAGIPQLIIVRVIPGIVTTVVLFLVYCLIDGYIGRNLAKNFF